MRALTLSAALLVALASIACRSGLRPSDLADAGTTGAADAGGLLDSGVASGGPPDGGSTSAAECAGLSPDPVGQPSASVALVGTHYDSWAGRTDGAGTVALIRTNDNEEPPFTLRVLDPSGVERGTYESVSTSFAETVFPQREGFVVSGFDAGARGIYLAAIDPNGSVLATAADAGKYAGGVADDPLGGFAMVLKRLDHLPSAVVAAYDERLNLRFRIELASTEEPIAIGVDRQGNSLVLLDAKDRYGSGNIGGIWIDHSGNAGAEFLALEGVASPPSIFLTPRVGSGLFAGRSPGPPTSAAWVRQFEPMGEGNGPPDWLLGRVVTPPSIVRDGRAYAFVDQPRSDALCDAAIEVVAPSGTSCGTAVFAADPSSPHCGAGLVLGRDGTVVEGAAVDAPGGERRTFLFRWWTGFLH